MAAGLRFCSFLLVFLIPSYILADNDRHVKFEYKFSLKGPHIVNKKGLVPFWNYGGSTIPSDEQVRLTPSLRDMKGHIWTRNRFEQEFWEIETQFRVTGRGRVGADGLAIWFTEEMSPEGIVFGCAEKWKGLGVFFDSFDNDGQQNNPFVSVVVNDGSMIYDHHSDGKGQQAGGCLRDFRNRPNPVRAKIRYYQNVLTVWFHLGMSTSDEDYELCTRVDNVNLPKQGYFGASAATGGLADDHDVLSFITHSLQPPKKEPETPPGMSAEEQQKLTQQYEEYQKKLEEQKKQFAAEHPDKVKKPEEHQYENVYERDIRLIYEGQNAIHHMLNNLHTKTSELTTQVNTLHTLVTSDHSKMNSLVQHDQTINRQEVSTLINLQQQLSNKVQEVSNMVEQVKGGQRGIEKRDAPDTSAQLTDMQNTLDSLTHTVNNLVSKQQFAGQGGEKKLECPPPPPMPQCIGPGYFILLIIAQLCMLVGYVMYRNQKEAAAKKFF